MLNFPSESFYKKNGVCCVKDDYIEQFAEQMLKDFNANLLAKPQPTPWQRFLEFYLGRDVRYERIAIQEFGEEILGVCSFDDNVPLRIYDKETRALTQIILNTGDIVINSTLENQPARLIFTALHEGGHWSMHQYYYFALNPHKNQIRMDLFGDENKQIKCCRKGDFRGKQKLIEPQDFLEHQANTFASAIAIPKTTVLPFVEKLKKRYKYETKDENGKPQFSLDALGKIIDEVSKIYGTSNEATFIRLKKLGVWDDALNFDKYLAELEEKQDTA